LQVINRYFFREITITLIGVLLIILLVFTSKHFVRYMADAASGELPTYMIVQLLSLFVLSYLVMILPFSLYIAVLTTMGRMYRDSEITALEACGIGIPSITRTIAWVGVSLSVIVAVLSLYFAPWAEEMQYAIRDKAKVESELGFLEPGRFHEIRGGKGVFYMESLDDEGLSMSNVFVYVNDEGKRDIFSAASGYQETDLSTGAQFIVLEDGYRFEELPGEQGYRIHEYGRSGVRVAKEEIIAGQRPRIAWTTQQLLASGEAEDIAELQWRVSMPVACIILTLLAVIISRTTPRQGRFAKLFVAFLLYVVYLYLLMLARSWVKSEVVNPWIGMWWVHILALFTLLVLTAKQFGTPWLLSKLRLKTI